MNIRPISSTNNKVLTKDARKFTRRTVRNHEEVKRGTSIKEKQRAVLSKERDRHIYRLKLLSLVSFYFTLQLFKYKQGQSKLKMEKINKKYETKKNTRRFSILFNTIISK